MNTLNIKETFYKLVDEGRDGFTLDLKGNEIRPSVGFAVAFKTCKTLDEALNIVGPTQYIGFWINPETQETCVEVVDLYSSKLQAVVCGIIRGEKAVYDFATDSTIDLRGFTDGKANQD